MTVSLLRPDPVEMGREWERIVIEEFEQVESIREWRDEDYYQPIARHFTDDPRRTDDEILNRLKALSGPGATWLDVGAGGGRYALPLALSSKQVIAVEPSEGMRKVLSAQCREHGIDNVEIRDFRWPDGSDELSADFSLNSHVGYDIRDINAFIDGLERASQEWCISLLMDRAPSGGFVRLWERVHGFKRQQLPAMREFVHLLLARGASPAIEFFPRHFRPWSYEDLIESARRRLWLVEGSEKDQLLLRLLAEERAGIENYEQPTMIALIRWRPVRKARAAPGRGEPL
jgi:SAM-dependent methyltransferase